MKLSIKQCIHLTLTTAALSTSVNVLAADKVNFQLDWLPGGDKAPVYVAVQQGFLPSKILMSPFAKVKIQPMQSLKLPPVLQT